MIRAIDEKEIFEISERGEKEGLEDERAVQVLDTRAGSIGIGPVRLEYDIDLNPPSVRVAAFIFSVKIGQVVLNQAQASSGLSGNVGLAKASVSLTADFQKTLVRYQARACVRSWSGWKCRGSEGVLVNW